MENLPLPSIVTTGLVPVVHVAVLAVDCPDKPGNDDRGEFEYIGKRSGDGAARMIIISQSPFDPGALLNEFQANHPEAGAAVTFTGIVRSTPDRPITALILECYPELAQNEIATIRAAAIARFNLIDAAVLHRYGRLIPGEPIMQVLALASHRQAAFDGAQYLMDYLKTDAPFWKQEETAAGTEWVEAKAADDSAKERWTK